MCTKYWVNMAKKNWIDCRCYSKIKEYSVAKWKELTGWPLSRVYACLDAGLMPVSTYDQRVITAARGILGYLRKMAPVGHHSDGYFAAWSELIKNYRDALNGEVDTLSKGTAPAYIEDDIIDFIKNEDKAAARDYWRTLTLQSALKATGFTEWNVEHLAVVCKQKIIKFHQDKSAAAESGEKFSDNKWWWEEGFLPQDTRINIRVDVELRHTADSSRMRALLLLPSRLPSAADPQRADALESDLKAFKDYYTTWRKPQKDAWKAAKAKGSWTDAQAHQLSVEECHKFHELIDKLSSVRPILKGLKKDKVRLLREIIRDSND